VRWLLRIAVLGVVLLLLAGAGLVVYLPRIVQRPEVQKRIALAAQDATGRDLHYARLDVGLLPPRLVVEQPTLTDPRGAAPMRAERISLQVALAPLLARAVVVDTIEIDGAQLVARRTAQGIEIPGLKAAQIPEPSPVSEQAPATNGKPEGFAVAVRKLALRHSRLSLEDLSVKPPVTWTLEDLDANARGIAPDQPIPIALKARLASGGALQGAGHASLKGSFDVDVDLEDFPLASLAPYASGVQLDGSAQLHVVARGDAAHLEKLSAQLDLDAHDVAQGESHIRGALPLHVELAGPMDALAGRFDLDASHAEVTSGDAFHKPAGVALVAQGRLALAPTLLLDDVVLRLAAVKAKLRVESGRRTRLRVDAPGFELRDLLALSPAARDEAAEGQVALDGLKVQLEPLRLHGGVVVSGVSVPAGKSRATLSGRLEGKGDRLEGRGMQLLVAGQPFKVDVVLEDLGGARTLQIVLSGKDADSGALLAALSGRKDSIEGPLTLDTDLRAPLGGAAPLLKSLQGSTSFVIKPGRLRGVSFLKSTFDQLGGVGEAALLAGRLNGGRTLQKFYEDRFDRFSATLHIAHGVARTDDLRLDYRHYRVNLRGSLGLLDQRLDMAGELTIFEKIDEALSNQGQGAEAGGQRGVRRVIPLAHVGGTLDAPKVEITPEVAVRLAGAYALDRKRRQKITGEIDKALGKGSGEQVLDALQGILGGGRKRAPQR